MKNLRSLDAYRNRVAEMSAYGTVGGDGEGVFEVLCPRTGGHLRVIASSGLGWDHVSVSLEHRTPNWYEMDFVKRLFFEPDEVAMQLHVAEKNHINRHPNCLHLWRPQNGPIPLPPSEFVA